MIRAEMVGNCGKSPELTETKTGKAMCKFSLASNSKSKSGEVSTSWVNVLCFDEMASEVATRIQKGDRCFATGRLNVEEYEFNGEKRTSVTLIADEVGPSLRFAPKSATPF